MLTTASSTIRNNLSTNKFFWLLACLFLSYWIYGWFYCIDRQDWIIENLLVVILLSVMIAAKKMAQAKRPQLSMYFLICTASPVRCILCLYTKCIWQLVANHL